MYDKCRYNAQYLTRFFSGQSIIMWWQRQYQIVVFKQNIVESQQTEMMESNQHFQYLAFTKI